MAVQEIGLDLVKVFDEDGELIATLAWGDPVDVIARQTSRVKIGLTRFVTKPDGTIEPSAVVGFVKRPKTKALDEQLLVDPASSDVLRLDFVDVQQGDASVIETPSGRVMLIDGGDNQLFARYLANRFQGTTDAAPKEIDCILVTHGDADHFAGLTEIHDSETNANPLKRLFISPRRVFHNGLVKRPSSVPEGLQLGKTKKVGKETIITGLVDDLRKVADKQMNRPFLDWKKALEAFTARGPLEMRRLELGADVFDFLGDGITIEVLGPTITKRTGAAGLLFLGEPSKDVAIGHGPPTFRGRSVSHTINGHSIVFRLTFGNWRFLYAGDLNEQAEGVLTAGHKAGTFDLTAEVLKVPHHGSADFSGDFLAAVRPLVSVVSSGDESERKEYIHPRATLMGALGRHSREGSLVFVTELVAFFKSEGFVDRPPPPPPPASAPQFFAFSRAAFGIVKIRCSRDRLLVYTNSGQASLKEAYAFEWRDGFPQPAKVLQA